MRRLACLFFMVAWLAAAPLQVMAASFQVTIANGSISAPDTVDFADTLEVTVPEGMQGQIEIWGPIRGLSGSAPEGLVIAAPLVGSVTRLEMNLRAGSYELRLTDPRGKIRARRLLDVSAPPLLLALDEAVGAGGAAKIRWSGPADPGDRLQIYDPETRGVVSEVEALGIPGSQMLTEMQMPATQGDYQLRYVLADGTVLRSLPVTIGPRREWLRSPLGVATRQRFEVSWHGAARAGYRFRIVTRDGDLVRGPIEGETADGRTVAILTAPATPGRYRVEYADPASDAVASAQPLGVTD